MLTTIDKERGCEPVAIPQPRQPRAPESLVTVGAKPVALWVLVSVLALVASGLAVSRVKVLGFSLGLGLLAGPSDDAEVLSLPWELPYGKGMWMWQPEKSDGGDVETILTRAKEVGLTHIYVRTGSTWDGFYAGEWLDKLLPKAHAAGIRIYGWDFPRLIDPAADVERGLAAIRYQTPGGHRLDGFAPDIETQSEGTRISAEAAIAYADALRAGAGVGYPLIACVPRPSPWTKSFFPYAEVVSRFDAVAPMVYWLNRQPGPDVQGAINHLRDLGKPVFPVGQAYDGAPEGGRRGVPPRAELHSFMQTAHAEGAQGVSFWSWQAADQQAWDAIRDAGEFARPGPPAGPKAVLAVQPIVLEAG